MSAPPLPPKIAKALAQCGEGDRKVLAESLLLRDATGAWVVPAERLAYVLSDVSPTTIKTYRRAVRYSEKV